MVLLSLPSRSDGGVAEARLRLSGRSGTRADDWQVTDPVNLQMV